LFFFFSGSIATLRSQDTNTVTPVVVEVSNEKTIIDGNTYYLHTVKKGENIYRIGLAYKVTLKDIIIANPDVISGTVKEGQILKIPAEQKAPRSIQSIESDKFIYHITEEQQTIFFLTQKYKVTQEELVKYNPELEYSPLQVGQVVRIPKSVNTSTDHETFHPIDNYEEYEARRRDTKYSIAKKYDITIEELEASNPDLKYGELKSGQMVKIPVKNKVELVSKPSTAKRDSLLNKPKPEITSTLEPKYNNATLNVAMLLPLFVEETETLMMIDSANASVDARRSLQANDIYQRSLNILEFYQGALLAIDSLKKAGLSIKLSTYDVGKNTTKLNTILAKPEMAKMDVIIGPFYTDQVEKTAEFAKTNQINIISPVSDSSKTLTNNPFAFQVIPTERVGIDALVKYASTFTNANIILFSTNSDKELSDIYRNKLNAYCPQRYKEVPYYAMKYPNFVSIVENRFAKDKDNIVLIPSESKTTLTDLLNKLGVVARNYPIKVFGSSVSIAYESIDPEVFYTIQYHYYSAFYTDFSSPDIKLFLQKYRNAYATEPIYHYDQHPRYFTSKGYNYGFLGYDVALHFLDLAGMQGKDFGANIQSDKKPLHSTFKFERATPNHGWMNKGINIIRYTKDFSIEKVK
jgi:ABC-type branched-subunit amino acid transport system substrate-binding protein/LysM repeat protein